MAGDVWDKAEIFGKRCSSHGDRRTDLIHDSCAAEVGVHCRVNVGAQGA